MRVETARTLARLTGEFYAREAASFSATRSAPWPGWQRVVEAVGTPPCGRPLKLLDLACGNLRFERYVAEELRAQGAGLEAYAVDSCDELASTADAVGASVRYRHLDVVEALFEGADLGTLLGVRDCDLAVCFGFMHHLALAEHRAGVLRALVEAVRPGGLVAVSFWQLSKSERLLRKARETTALAVAQRGLDDLAPGDYLLGWQDRADVLRFCHDFSEDEIDELACSVRSLAKEEQRFSADGASSNLNRYLLLQRREG